MKKRCTFVVSSNDKPKWLAERRKYVSATDVPTILALNYFKSPVELFQDKLFGSKFVANQHTARGQQYEPIIIEAWAKKRGVRKKANSIFMVSCKYPWLGATPDCFARVNGETVLVEIKCPSKAWSSAPANYVWQVKVQLVVTGLKKGLLVAANAPDVDATMREWEVSVTPEEEALIARASEFFHKSVKNKNMPPEYWLSFEQGTALQSLI